jgi:chromate transporter
MNPVEIFKFFFKLGMTGFGGPLALVEEMRLHFVVEKQFLTNPEFNKVYMIIKAMPGPLAFQFAVYLGRQYGGIAGAFLAGAGLLIPSFFLMVSLGYFYTSFQNFTELNRILIGMQYSVAGVILYGLYNISKDYFKIIPYYIFVILCMGLYLFKLVPEVLLILMFGFLAVIYRRAGKTNGLKLVSVAIPILGLEWEKLYQMLKVFFIAGTFIFGTGLAAFPYFKTELVHNLGFLDLKTFNDGVSFGQMSPGPVTIGAVFYGFKVASISGAILALLALYITPFVHMVTWFPGAVRKLSKLTWIQDFVMGASAAIVGTIGITVFEMNQHEITNFNFWMTLILILAVLTSYKKISIFKVIFSFSLLNYIYLMFVR